MSDKIAISKEKLKVIIRLLDRYYDFSGYKENTLKRRISKRMQAMKLSDPTEYIQYLENHFSELQQLAFDIFINVTRFFRDRNVFKYLEEILLPQLIKAKHPHQAIRIWSAGCASGEEAYSIAILLNEYEEKHNCKLNVKIIATDVKASSIEKAKKGIFSTREVHQLPLHYLSKYFQFENNHYKIKKTIKKRVLFSIHDITQDPPFGKMDLVLCRNLLIYFNRDLQQKIFTNIAFSLNLKGYLILGKSETLVDHNPIFTSIQPSLKIYAKVSNKRQEHFFHLNVDYKSIITGVALSNKQAGNMDNPSITNAFQQLLYRRYSPAVVVIDSSFRVKHISRKARQYVDVPEDYTHAHDLFSIAAPEINAVVRTAMNQMQSAENKYEFPNVRLIINKQEVILNIAVETLLIDQNQSFYTIVFTPASDSTNKTSTSQSSNLIQDINLSLQNQLLQTEQNLQKTIQELEASNQNLLASNEELQSTNEEYISVNEELQSINSEYQLTIEELSQANQDIDHILQSTDIGTLFLDSQLRIRKFTNAIQPIINLTKVDINRPFSHITNNLQNIDLIAEAKLVMKKARAVEKEVQLKDGSWYLMQLTPYQEQQPAQIGTVISFINIQPLKLTEAALRKQQLRYSGIFHNTYQFIGLLSTDGILLEANETALAFGGLKPEDVLNKPLWNSYWWQISKKAQTALKKAIKKAASGEFVQYNETVWGANRTPEIIDFTLKPLFNEEGEVVFIVPEGRLISEEVNMRNALQKNEQQYRALIEGSQELIQSMDLEGNLLFVNQTWKQKLGYTDEDLKTLKIFDIIPAEMHEHCQMILQQVVAGELTHKINVVFQTKTGESLKLYGDLVPNYEKEEITNILVFLKDVTEQRKIELALKESEELYRSLFETSYLGLMLYDLDSQKTITANPTAMRLLGYDADEIITKGAYDFVPSHLPDGSSSRPLIDDMTERVRQGEFIHRTIPSQHKDGTIFMTDLTISPVVIKNKVHALASIRDITEEIQQAQIIETSQRRFKAVFDHHPVGISVANKDNIIIEANQLLVQMLGYTKEELIGLSFVDITHPEDRTSNKERLLKLIEGDIEYISFEKRYLRKDGSHFLAQISVSIYYNEENELIYLASIQDIDQQRQTELQLIERERLYRNLYDNSYNAICIIDITGSRLIDCNDRYLELFECTKEVIPTIDPMLFVASTQHEGQTAVEFVQNINAQIVKNGSFSYPFIGNKLKSKQAFYAKATSILHEKEGSQQIIVLVQDIDAAYRYQATIEQKVNELDEKNKELEKYINSNLELENFAYIASHDLREPLRTITSFSQLLRYKHNEHLPQEAKEYLQFIHQATRNLNMVVEDLLKFSRVNTQEFIRQNVDLNQLIKTIQQDLQNKIELEKVTFEIQLLPSQLSVNQSQIYQVFQNLINNAIKFHHPDRLPIISINAKQEKDIWHFTITDNGIGIEEEYQEKIFLLFKRLHNKEKYEGTGLGLAICKKVIEKHGGKIWMESKYGEGTTFHFTIPIVEEY